MYTYIDWKAGGKDYKRITITSLLIAFAVIIAFGIIAVLKYHFTGEGIQCIIHKNLGVQCPTCGTTRMIEALLMGNVKEAIGYNAFIFFTSPFLLVFMAWQLYEAFVKDRILEHIDIIVTVYAAALFSFAVIRNVM